MIFSFIGGKFGIKKMRKLRHMRNTVEYYPTLSNSCASESTVPRNVFLDFDTLALVLNRDSDRDSR